MSSLCIVMVCTDTNEAEQVGQQLAQIDKACLVTYRKVEDLMFNAPARKVALMILATDDSPMKTKRTLQWLRRRWSRCPVTVIGDEGGGEQEMAAREGGASYLTRPVAPDFWTALLSHSLCGADQVIFLREQLGCASQVAAGCTDVLVDKTEEPRGGFKVTAETAGERNDFLPPT